MHHVTRRPWRALAAVALTVLVLPAAASAAPATPAQINTAIERGASWIAAQQDKLANGASNPNPTGGLPGFNDTWAATALAAAGINAADVQRPGVPQSLQDYLFSTYDAAWGTLPAPQYPASPSFSAGKLAGGALIASAAGIDPTTIAPNVNLAATLASLWDADQGNFGGAGPNSDGEAVLAARVLHLPRGVVRKVDAALRRAQKPDGGWDYTMTDSGTGDPDVSGLVLSMLCQDGARPGDPAVDRGLDYLHGQLDDTTGGFKGLAPYVPDNNTSTTAWAVTGLKACGVDPQSAAWTTSNGKNPVTFLLSQQRTDASGVFSGSFKYLASSPDFDPDQGSMDSTQAAVRALSDYAWDVPAPARANPAYPRMRPAPAVADGTVVPIALGVDDGAGDVRFCAVKIPSGTPLTEVLQTASTTSIPSGCVRGLRVSGGAVAALNGATTTTYRGWQVQIDGGAPEIAGTQRVGFGDVVSLEYGWYTTQQITVPGPGSVVTVVREVPVPVPTKTTKKKAKKTKATAACRVQRGKKAAGKKRAKDQVRCTVKHAKGTSKRSTARLTRHGRLYAKGTRNRLRQHRSRRLVVGHHYTLRLGKGKKITKIRVTLRAQSGSRSR